MKAIVGIIFLSFLLQISYQDTVCDVIKCAEKSLQGDLCYKERENNLIELQKCSPGEACDFTRGSSKEKYCAKYVAKVETGEKCAHNEDCLTDNCIDSVCKSKTDGSKCKEQYDCGKNQYCLVTCFPVIPTGGACLNIGGLFEACDFDNVCNLGLCVKMYSLATGQPANEPSACKSNYVHQKICAETEPIDGKTLKECNKDDDCVIKISFGDEAVKPSINDKGNCKCASDGKKYCDITTKDEVWQNYLTTYAEKVTGISKEKIRIMTDRSKGWGNDAILEAKRKMDHYSDLINADKCVSDFILNNSAMLRISLFSLIAAFALTLI